MNVSLRRTDCFQKSLYSIFFSSFLSIMHIKVVFISTDSGKLRKCCIAAVP